jgi:hypothetical protein
MALGINRFEDVTWFNKESFEEALFWTSLFLLAGNSGEQAACITAVRASLLKAEEVSGYRLDELLGALTGNNEKAKKTAKILLKKPPVKKK